MQSSEEIQAAYDKASSTYAREFIHELDHKPKDRELLARFASLVGQNNGVLDIGCGPGHTTDHLSTLGLAATGIDLSPGMIEQASKHFPRTKFACDDLLALSWPNESVKGILAFYCIVHLTQQQLPTAFNEVYRVLQRDGVFLVSFHIGSGTIHHDNFLDSNAILDFYFFEIDEIEPVLQASGFQNIEVIRRPPYETEYPSERCYIFAFK